MMSTRHHNILTRVLTRVRYGPHDHVVVVERAPLCVLLSHIRQIIVPILFSKDLLYLLSSIYFTRYFALTILTIPDAGTSTRRRQSLCKSTIIFFSASLTPFFATFGNGAKQAV
jgi:hypothetical protein